MTSILLYDRILSPAKLSGPFAPFADRRGSSARSDPPDYRPVMYHTAVKRVVLVLYCY